MKRLPLPLNEILTCLALIFLGACGDDKPQNPGKASTHDHEDSKVEGEASEPSRQAQATAPVREQEPPPASNWVGNSAYYAATFEERMDTAIREKTTEVLVAVPSEDGVENEASRKETKVVTESVNLLRLYVRSGSTPFTGSVTRLYLSGAPEFHSTFDDGFRNGIAYWWDKNGNLTQATKGWGDGEVNLDLNATANPIQEILQELAKSAAEPDKPIFRGTLGSFDDWNGYDDEGRLLDGSTGEIVSGEIKLYGEDGKLESEAGYLEGVKHGASNNFHQNGVQSMKTLFARGVKTGTETWWSDNGLKTYEANFVNGNLNGLETVWDENGVIISQHRYQEGDLVETIVEQK